MFNLSKGRNFVQHCGQNDNVVAKNVNYVEATFDFVEKKTKFYDKLGRHCCSFWQQSRTLVASTLLLVWTEL